MTLHRKHGAGQRAGFPEQEAGVRIVSRSDGKHRQQLGLLKKGKNTWLKISQMHLSLRKHFICVLSPIIPQLIFLIPSKIMKSNWEEITIEILSEHVGALAGIIVDDARAKCQCSPVNEPLSFMTEFILCVTNDLPESIDRTSIFAHLRAALK